MRPRRTTTTYHHLRLPTTSENSLGEPKKGRLEWLPMLQHSKISIPTSQGSLLLATLVHLHGHHLYEGQHLVAYVVTRGRGCMQLGVGCGHSLSSRKR